MGVCSVATGGALQGGLIHGHGWHGGNMYGSQTPAILVVLEVVIQRSQRVVGQWMTVARGVVVKVRGGDGLGGLVGGDGERTR